ncbi:amidohydrolase [Penicillium waksmanii]|uniref:amidohydrolase n=1 Tax=Penicillium waksmanii TaxID=69791 RepID=UPI002547F9FD|nr:amidohydrolase [Penicillium waksmanii]KAJ5974795.1 amidohydrolase [Penicillium waksmanii]
MSAPTDNGTTAIKNVRVFNGEKLTEPTTVYIESGIIVDHVEGAVEVDGQGGVLLPGLIDAHIHLHHTGHLRKLAKWGVTTGLDMATWPADKMNGLRNREGLTDIRSAGLPATINGSLHSHMLPLPPAAFLSGPGDAPNFVKERIEEGSDFMKIISDVPGPSQATMTAVVEEAHKHGKMVIAHASAYVPFQMAQESHADVITHSPRNKAVDAPMIARMLEDHCISVPTLTMMKAVSQPPDLGAVFGLLSKPTLLWAIFQAKRRTGGAEKYENSRDSVAAMHQAGIPILAGTDCHEEPNSPFSVPHGESLHLELELLVEAGLSNLDALRAATSLPAKYFRLTDRGAIEVGKRANLVLLGSDPLQRISATRDIRQVWCGGRKFENEC